MNYDGNNDPFNFMNLLVFLYIFLLLLVESKELFLNFHYPLVKRITTTVERLRKKKASSSCEEKRQMAMEKINSSLNRDYKKEIHDVIN